MTPPCFIASASSGFDAALPEATAHHGRSQSGGGAKHRRRPRVESPRKQGRKPYAKTRGPKRRAFAHHAEKQPKIVPVEHD
jgi:hypothetical protein